MMKLINKPTTFGANRTTPEGTIFGFWGPKTFLWPLKFLRVFLFGPWKNFTIGTVPGGSWK